jgi:hypothetical protein
MATFYLLPPRSCLEQALGEVLGRFLPDLPLPADTWDIVTDRLGSAAHWPDDVFLVSRDDLPEGEPLGEALSAAFGAEPGDRVVEVSLARGPSGARSWLLGQGAPRAATNYAANISPRVPDQADVSSVAAAR